MSPKWKQRQVLLGDESIDRLALAFEVGFFETVLGTDPDHVGALEALGNVYTRIGRVADGLAVDQRLVKLLPDHAIAHYNLACSFSLLNDVDRALAALECAVRLGYRDFEYLERDPDLVNLRRDPRYLALVRKKV